jgi:hypothetical protein
MKKVNIQDTTNNATCYQPQEELIYGFRSTNIYAVSILKGWYDAVELFHW